MSALDAAAARYAAGAFGEALELALDGLPGLLNVAAAAAYAQGQRQAARRYWQMALSLAPGDADAHNNLGLLLAEDGQPAQAEAAYRRALAACPGHATAWNNLGIALERQQRPDAAEAAYRAAIAAQPGYAEAYDNLGNLLASKNRHRDAEAAFRQAIALGRQACYAPLGGLLCMLNRPAEAEAVSRRALATQPANPTVYNNLGIALATLDRHAEAEAAFRQALALGPNIPGSWCSLGVLLAKIDREAEAEAAYRQALALHPGHAATACNLAFLLLGQGRFREGWALQETRYHPEQTNNRVPDPSLPFPRWQGEPLAGKSLLIWPEQGFGDEIQFCRFAPQLKTLGAARVSLLCKPPLAPLLQTLDGLDALYPGQAGQTFPPHDYWAFPLSLPLHLGIEPDNIPARLPYLQALPERIVRWQTRLPAHRPRIGLAWKGYGGHGNDARRSLPGLGTLAPLWTVPGVVFVSLQKGAGEEEALDPPAGLPITALGQDIEDFADTAALAAQLDLVICVDTALAHLCGALGRPCWVLLPCPADWRWLQRREDSPWYPGALRLFRQAQGDTWDDVAGRVAQALRLWRHAFP